MHQAQAQQGTGVNQLPPISTPETKPSPLLIGGIVATVFAACWYVSDWSVWVPYLVALMVAIGARNVISFLRHKPSDK